MIGYKAFDENLQCRGFQFEVGKTYETGKVKEELKLCSDTVFHFCRELHKIELESNYTISKSRVCEVIAEGDIVTNGDKYDTNKLTILREIPREELNKYNNRNSDNRNSGNRIYDNEEDYERDRSLSDGEVAGYKKGFRDGAEFGYNKANEWHKVADGDLPDNSRYVWTNVGAGYHDDDGWWDAFGRLQGVIAWGEPRFEEV